MDGLRKVINNTVISLLGQVVTWTSTLLLTVAYGRFLGDVKFGELFFAITFVMLFGVPLEFGFNQQLTREVAQKPDRALRYLSNTLLLKGVLWLILYSLILLVCWLLGYNAEERVLVSITGFTLLSTSLTNAFRALHYAFERVVFPVVGTILEKGLSALVGILLLKYGAGVQIMALVLLGGSLANCLWQALWFFRLTGASFVTDRALIRTLIRTGIPFMAYGALAVIYYRIDTVLLSLMTNVAVVGWYGAGYRLFDTMSFLPNLVISAIMYPVFSRLSVTSEAGLKLAIEKSMNFLLFCGLPMSIGLFVAAPEIIAFLYHRPEFSHTVPALRGLAPGLVFLYINTVFSTIIISTKREKKITIMAAIALVFNLALNFILIPLYQHVGAAIVTSLTELLLLCLSVIFIPKHLLPLGSLRVAAKATIASFVMALTIWGLSVFHIFNILVILPVAMLVYFGTATLIGTIPREDIRALYYAIRHKAHRSPSASSVSQQEQNSFPRVDTSSLSTLHPELALGLEDGEAFFDEYAETQPQLEVPWWLRRYHSQQ
jgi:O-antigen/teichoic acid export membrane protein